MNVKATPANPALPTVGPWMLACSECGPLEVTTTTLATDGALLDHIREHAAAVV